MTRPATPPQVAVIVTCYNLGAYLDECLGSIAGAGFDAVEVVVVDDGSTQTDTLDRLQRLDTQHEARHGLDLRVLHQDNQGVSVARNTGIAAVATPYILPLDADDRLSPGFVEQAVRAMQADDALGVVYGDVKRFGDEEDTWRLPAFDPVQILVNNFVPVTALIRRSAWEACGGFDSEVASHEDWELWINLSGRGWTFRHLPVVALEYRARPDSKVKMWDKPDVRRRLMRYVCRKHADLYRDHAVEVVTRKEIEKCELSNLVRELKAFVEEADEQITEHARSLQERIEFIDKLTQAFRGLEAHSEALTRDLAARDDELRGIHATRWWRLASWFARLKGESRPSDTNAC